MLKNTTQQIKWVSLLLNGKNKSIIIYNTQYFPHLYKKEHYLI